ncbi:MAG TPA: mandelate racemase/muconate lactonizing enzyme family protein, partial [Gaiellales bacterium]
MTRIARIEARAIGPEVPRYRYTEALDAPYTTTTIVWVEDSDGARGVGGFDGDSWGGFDLAPLETLRAVSRELIGLDAEDREGIQRLLTRGGTSPSLPGVLSAIDIALWDLAGQRAGRPICALLGGTLDRLPTYASLPTTELGAYLELVAEVRAKGYPAVKLHAYGDAERDIELHRAVHAEHPDLAVMHDAEGVYAFDDALAVGRALDEVGARWYEAAFPDFDLASYRRLRAALTVPVLPAGDAVWERHQFEEALRDPPWDTLRTDVTAAGGITPMRAIFALAAERDMDVEPVSYGHTLVQAANLHVMLAYGRSAYFEQAYPLEAWEYGVVTPIRADAEGMTHVPAGPGLGVEL